MVENVPDAYVVQGVGKANEVLESNKKAGALVEYIDEACQLHYER